MPDNLPIPRESFSALPAAPSSAGGARAQRRAPSSPSRFAALVEPPASRPTRFHPETGSGSGDAKPTRGPGDAAGAGDTPHHMIRHTPHGAVPDASQHLAQDTADDAPQDAALTPKPLTEWDGASTAASIPASTPPPPSDGAADEEHMQATETTSAPHAIVAGDEAATTTPPLALPVVLQISEPHQPKLDQTKLDHFATMPGTDPRMTDVATPDAPPAATADAADDDASDNGAPPTKADHGKPAQPHAQGNPPPPPHSEPLGTSLMPGDNDRNRVPQHLIATQTPQNIPTAAQPQLINSPGQVVAPPTHTIAPSYPALAVSIATQIKDGRSQFDIQLDPAELGRIDVRLAIDKHGAITSHVIVELSETLDLLRRDAQQLQRAFDDAGLKLGQNGLQFSLRDQSSSHGRSYEHDNAPAHRQHAQLLDETASAVPADTQGHYLQLRTAARLDIRI